MAGFESDAAARAFASLPERWQLVLWHTEVEGQRPAEVAPLLGLTPNAVSQLAHRAREGLRQAFVSMHVHDAGEPRSACQATRANLGAYIRAGLSSREAARVSAHLECCRPCTAIYLELVEVDTDLRGLLAPLLLGGAAAAYLSDVPVSVAPTALASFGGFLKSGPGKVLAGTAAAGLTVTAFVLGGTALMAGGPDGSTDRSVVADAAGAAPAAREPAVRQAGQAREAGVARADGHPVGGQHRPLPAEPGLVRAADPVAEPVTDPVTDPRPTLSRPRTRPTDPTQDPTQDPTPDPTAVDVRVSASKAGIGPAAVVTVDVAGLAPGQPGTVTVTADQLSASLSLDPRCTLLGINTATCQVVGAGRLQMLAAGLGLLTPTTLTITASPGAGLHDPAMGDNTDSHHARLTCLTEPWPSAGCSPVRCSPRCSWSAGSTLSGTPTRWLPAPPP